MYTFDLISYLNRGCRALRSSLYILLILSMLWIPSPMDVSATVSSNESSNEFFTEFSTENFDSNFTCKEGISETKCYNVDAQTLIIIPRQQNVDEVEVIATSPDETAMMSSADDEFEATRGIMGLRIIDRNTGEHITHFEPSIRIETAYSWADVEAAGGLRKLTLGYFNGEFMQAFSHIEIQGDWRWGTISAEIRELSVVHQPVEWMEDAYPWLFPQTDEKFLPSWYQSCARCNSQIYMGGGND